LCEKVSSLSNINPDMFKKNEYFSFYILNKPGEESDNHQEKGFG